MSPRHVASRMREETRELMLNLAELPPERLLRVERLLAALYKQGLGDGERLALCRLCGATADADPDQLALAFEALTGRMVRPLSARPRRGKL